jgi:hypothetical protein
MAKYAMIHEGGHIEHVTARGYKDMQRYVQGLITMPWEGNNLDGKATVIANDEAIILGMEHNPLASFLLGQRIFGPVLIGGPTGDEGDIQDVDSHLITKLHREYLEFLMFHEYVKESL